MYPNQFNPRLNRFHPRVGMIWSCSSPRSRPTPVGSSPAIRAGPRKFQRPTGQASARLTRQADMRSGPSTAATRRAIPASSGRCGLTDAASPSRRTTPVEFFLRSCVEIEVLEHERLMSTIGGTNGPPGRCSRLRAVALMRRALEAVGGRPACSRSDRAGRRYSCR